MIVIATPSCWEPQYCSLARVENSEKQDCLLPSDKSQTYSAMSPSRFAGAASFPDVALEGILEYGLCVPNLMDVSSVCRLWMKAAKEPMSWGGKKVFIEGARGITPQQLSAWLPCWRRAERLHLTYSQMDLLPVPLTVPHAIVHLWQSESERARNISWRERTLVTENTRPHISSDPLGFWNEISILDIPCLACLTADRAPDDVCLMREELDDDGVDLWAPIVLGWTNAKTFDELAEGFSAWYRNGHTRSYEESHFVICGDMFPDLTWERGQRTWLLAGHPRRARVAPLFQLWGESGGRATLCNAHLDRKRNEIQLTTESNLMHRFRMRGDAQLMPEELRFFVAMPDDPPLRRHQRRHWHRNFVELPVPFLASTLRQS